MKKIILYIAICIVITFSSLFFLKNKYTLSKDNELTIIGYTFLISSLILIYFQIRINLRYNKRKAALDFCFNQIQKELFPLLKQLKEILHKDFLVFTKEDAILALFKSEILQDKKAFRSAILDILNFYERMAIAILKDAFDEDICYDDHGFNLIHFYNWSIPFINELHVQHKEERLFINFVHIAEKWQAVYLKRKKFYDKMASRSRKRKTIRDQSI